MNDMLNSLEGFDSGSNYKFGQKMEQSNNPRSLFDLSHLNTLTIDNAGILVPIALWETLPSDDFDISVDALLRVMPQVVPLYSRQRLFIYGFYSRYSDLWNHFQVFMDKGYTGNVQKKIPTLHQGVNIDVSDASIEPNTLLDYLGLPLGAASSALFGRGGSSENYAKISALPFMMYLRIYRDYFMNKNEWINDRVLLPDDDSRFRLDDDGRLLSAKDEGKNFYFSFYYNNQWYNDLETSFLESDNIYTMGLFYHDFPDDYFTSALPFTQRGTAETLKGSGKLNADIPLNFDSSFLNPSSGTYNSFSLDYIATTDPSIASLYGGNVVNSSGAMAFQDSGEGARLALNKGKALANNLPFEMDTGITVEKLREQIINQIELERLARTDGSYRQFGLSFFGESSKASYDFRPTYIGGTYKNIAFTEVIQNSPAVDVQEEGQTVKTSPLGSYAGHGITGISNGRIGHIHCDDYGMIMLIACIMPDVYYSQGLDRILTDSLQSDKFLPERVKLGMQPIYNKELFYSGNNGNEEGEDNYLWAYQNPFDYLRYIPNKIHGKIADMSNESFKPFTQSRKFENLPNWGREFSEAKNIRKDYLAAPIESAYTAQFGFNIRAVRPLPYKAIPAQLLA